MLKLATFIVDKRNLIFLLVIIGLIFSCFSAGWVDVENVLVWGNKNSVIPDYVTCIGDRAFASLKDLKEIKAVFVKGERKI